VLPRSMFRAYLWDLSFYASFGSKLIRPPNKYASSKPYPMFFPKILNIKHFSSLSRNVSSPVQTWPLKTLRWLMVYVAGFGVCQRVPRVCPRFVTSANGQ